ncbi:uncharacterized protein LOC133901017 [Phragmites australis]|uniref:uncharacterized protein LOC133901017 n=1 Tax=Phragmites australis TaxID=29695 RepID=UPI002D7A1D81|nr:uncharacterized protein LOC133901017 [Phragmites australis]
MAKARAQQLLEDDVLVSTEKECVSTRSWANTLSCSSALLLAASSPPEAERSRIDPDGLGDCDSPCPPSVSTSLAPSCVRRFRGHRHTSSHHGDGARQVATARQPKRLPDVVEPSTHKRTQATVTRFNKEPTSSSQPPRVRYMSTPGFHSGATVPVTGSFDTTSGSTHSLPNDWFIITLDEEGLSQKAGAPLLMQPSHANPSTPVDAARTSSCCS